MSQHRLITLSNPVPGREDEYNAWYDDVHLAEVLEIPGFVAVQRFALSAAQLDGFASSTYRYMTVYEFDRDPSEPLASLQEEVASGRMVLPADLIQVDEIAAWCFSAVGERETNAT